VCFADAYRNCNSNGYRHGNTNCDIYSTAALNSNTAASSHAAASPVVMSAVQ
jgi:hypothetical protein